MACRKKLSGVESKTKHTLIRTTTELEVDHAMHDDVDEEGDVAV